MNFAKKLELFWKYFYTKGFYEFVLEGLKNTLIIALSGLVIGVLLGTLIASVRVAPKYKKLIRVLDAIARFYVTLFRGTPIVVQLLVFYYVLLPLLGVSDGLSGVQVAIIVFGLNSAAYVSEIMRSGLQAVDPGQMEAGRSLGLSYQKTMLSIVIPQGIKNILPTLGNELISLIKETSVVSFVGATDLYVAFGRIAGNSYDFMVPYLAMAIVYVLLVALISLLLRILERRFSVSDRHH